MKTTIAPVVASMLSVKPMKMGKRNVVCLMRHTPLSPKKNQVRSAWMNSINKNKDIITISHGLLDVASILGWRGAIQVCDIDPGVRETTEYLRDDYPDMKILKPGEDIRETVRDYCVAFGPKNLGAVDVDLACTLKAAEPIFIDTLKILATHNYRGKAFLTVSLRSDGFSSTPARIKWLTDRLPKPFRYIRHTVYNSVKIADNASRSEGSVMCIVEVNSQHSAKTEILFNTLADHICYVVKSKPCINATSVLNAIKYSGHGGTGRGGTAVFSLVKEMLGDGRLIKPNSYIAVAN